MWRVASLIWESLRHRRGRTATLAVGILVASVSFILLTSAVQTSALEIRGVVRKSFRPSYDIVVRPKGTVSPLEREQGLVRNNYLSGIFGGITVGQWRRMLDIPGVEVAAPIANVGYVALYSRVKIPWKTYLTPEPSLLRFRFTWEANHGLSRYPGMLQYVYASPEVEEGGCWFGRQKDSPFGDATATRLTCIPLAHGTAKPASVGHLPVYAFYSYPVLLAAIDPVQENRLLGFDRSIVSGAALQEGQPYQPYGRTGCYFGAEIPVLASTRSYVDERLVITVEHIPSPSGSSDPSVTGLGRAFPRGLNARTGEVVGRHVFPVRDLYPDALRNSGRLLFSDYWTVSPPRYGLVASGRLQPRIIAIDRDRAWYSRDYDTGYFPALPANRDVQYRRVTIHNNVTRTVTWQATCNIQNSYAKLRVQGRFDPERLPGFDPLSQVPMESYSPPVAEPADTASRQALGGRPLMPTLNLGGYIQQPPFLFTTLQAAQGLLSPKFYEGGNAKAPISAIRVRVAGVTGPDPVSLGRIRTVAQLIQQRTGLQVDITAGSSPAPVLVQLPAGRFGQPPLLLREGWTKKGVALVILSALDRKSLALFVLILVVTGLFLANATFASVRARRTEIGTLLCLGWSRRHVFQAVLGELGLIGVLAGVSGAGIAALLVAVLSLDMPLVRTLLVVPLAATLAMVAGLIPARRASRGSPVDAVTPAVTGRALSRRTRGIGSMAWVGLRRVPGRTAVAAAGLVIGVGALAVLISVNLAFRGVLTGTLLGNFVAIQVRGVDYLSVALAIVLGGASVADVLFLNIRERAAEIATLRTSGWRDSHLARLVSAEGAGIGVLGSVLGAGLGVTAASLAGGALAQVAAAGAIAAACGVLVAVIASLVPAALVSRMSAPMVLAEE